MPGAPFDWKAYIVAALLVGAAGLSRIGLAFYNPHIVYFATFFPAVLLKALWGGPAPAIFATALSGLIAWFALLPPAFSFALEDRTSLVNLAMFNVSSALIIWIAERHLATQLLCWAQQVPIAQQFTNVPTRVGLDAFAKRD